MYRLHGYSSLLKPSSVDRLTHLLDHFSLRAGVFYTGHFCGVQAFEAHPARGHIHLIKRGPVQLIGAEKHAIQVMDPTLLFLPHPAHHRLQADENAGADIVCGSVQFEGGNVNPITDALPSVVLVKLAELTGGQALLDLMFEEAFSDRSGKQAILDRLCETLLINLLRHCIERGITQKGTLAGLSDIRLAKTLVAVHNDPAWQWDLHTMSLLAGMSRARFALRFRQITGETPADYLASWRVMLAQQLLKRGYQLKYIADDVGYSSASALTRAFTRKVGCAPSEWIKQQKN